MPERREPRPEPLLSLEELLFPSWLRSSGATSERIEETLELVSPLFFESALVAASLSEPRMCERIFSPSSLSAPFKNAAASITLPVLCSLSALESDAAPSLVEALSLILPISTGSASLRTALTCASFAPVFLASAATPPPCSCFKSELTSVFAMAYSPAASATPSSTFRPSSLRSFSFSARCAQK